MLVDSEKILKTIEKRIEFLKSIKDEMAKDEIFEEAQRCKIRIRELSHLKKIVLSYEAHLPGE